MLSEHMYWDFVDCRLKLQTPDLQQAVMEQRPATAKPRDPDSYDFQDEQLAKDYRKMYDRYNEMEEMMKAQSIGDDNERGTSD